MRAELKRILYVEDDDAIAEVAMMTLETLGEFDVTHCASGRRALEIYDEIAPQLVLLDVMMPEMDGPETMARMLDAYGAEVLDGHYWPFAQGQKTVTTYEIVDWADVPESVRHHFRKRANLRAGLSGVDPAKKTCMLYLQADHLFFEKMGSEEASIDVMTRHVQRVNSIYRDIGESAERESAWYSRTRMSGNLGISGLLEKRKLFLLPIIPILVRVRLY